MSNKRVSFAAIPVNTLVAARARASYLAADAIADKIISLARQNLATVRMDNTASGSIYTSFAKEDAQINQYRVGVRVVNTSPIAAPHEFGTRPYKPNIDSIRATVAAKNPDLDERGIAAIANGIYMKIEADGIEPKLFLSRAIDEVLGSGYALTIGKAYKLAFDSILAKTLKRRR